MIDENQILKRAVDSLASVCDGAADLVICSEVVEHLTDDARALKELYRVLKPGGLLILATPKSKADREGG